MEIRLELRNQRNLVGNIPLVLKIKKGSYYTRYVKSNVIDKWGITKAIKAEIYTLAMGRNLKKIILSVPFSNHIYLDDHLIESGEVSRDLIKFARIIRKTELNNLPPSLNCLIKSEGVLNETCYKVLLEREELLPPLIIKTHAVQCMISLLKKKKENKIPLWMDQILQYKSFPQL